MSALIAEGYEIGLERAPFLQLAELSGVLSLADLPEDEILRYQANRHIRSLGSVALAQEFDSDPETQTPNDTLLTAIKRGAEGDREAVQMVATNVGSDFSERVLKAGEITKYYLHKNAKGELMQFGQSYGSIYANTLRLTPTLSKMRPRTEAETRNADRIKYWHEQNVLEDNYVVVFSPCPDNMTDTELSDAGFFAETKTMAIQATTAEVESVSIESAFVAGVIGAGAERHDITKIIKLAAKLGIDYRDKSADQIIDSPLLIPKSLMPNGVIDLVALLDDGETFFGEDKPQQDYLEFRQFCDERRKSFANDVRIVTEKLLDEVDKITTPLQAIQRLGKLSGAQMVKRAIKDKTIDERVFGSEAAGCIEYARFQASMGNQLAVTLAEAKAIQTETSNSCPSGVLRQSEIDQNILDLLEQGDKNESEESDNESDDFGPLKFKCSKGHTNKRPRARSSRDFLTRCKTCHVSVKC